MPFYDQCASKELCLISWIQGGSDPEKILQVAKDDHSPLVRPIVGVKSPDPA